MTPQSSDIALQHLQMLFSGGSGIGLTDDQLLERFATRCPELAEPAFAALVERHGPMVLGVCRSVVRDEHLAHDAFQATFLVLARKAGSLRERGSLAPWLHLVARRVAVRARATEGRRRAVERRAAELAKPPMIGEQEGDDLGSILHEAIDGLPGRYRRAIVLCDLEGCTYVEAAASLGCPIGTVKSRLARARGLLRDRLLRRGVSFALVAPLTTLSAEAAGTFPPALAGNTIRAALATATRRVAVAGAKVAALAEGEIKAMGLLKLKVASLVFLVSGLLATGFVALAQTQGEPKEPPRAGQNQEPGGGDVRSTAEASSRLAKLLQEDPLLQPDGTYRRQLFLMELAKGKAVSIVDEPGSGHAYCGSPFWSSDGRQILFDATPMTDWALSRIMAIRLDDGPPRVTHLGMGNCPNLSPDGKLIYFLSNEEGGIWVMNADGSNRARIGSSGRPKLSPDGRQILISSYSSPCRMSLLDLETAGGRPLRLPHYQIFSIPNWVDPALLIAVIGVEEPDTIALLEVTATDELKVASVLWKKEMGPDVTPANPVYHPDTRRCSFIGTTPKGMALFSLEAGDPAPPKRLEPAGFDRNMSDLALSPDGRFLIFNSDRGDRPPK